MCHWESQGFLKIASVQGLTNSNQYCGMFVLKTFGRVRYCGGGGVKPSSSLTVS